MVHRLTGGEYVLWKIELDPDTLLLVVVPGPAHVEAVLLDQDLVLAAGAEGIVGEAGVTAKTAGTAGVKKKMEVSRGITAAVKKKVQTWSIVKETGARAETDMIVMEVQERIETEVAADIGGIGAEAGVRTGKRSPAGRARTGEIETEVIVGREVSAKIERAEKGGNPVAQKGAVAMKVERMVGDQAVVLAKRDLGNVAGREV